MEDKVIVTDEYVKIENHHHGFIIDGETYTDAFFFFNPVSCKLNSIIGITHLLMFR